MQNLIIPLFIVDKAVTSARASPTDTSRATWGWLIYAAINRGFCVVFRLVGGQPRRGESFLFVVCFSVVVNLCSFKLEKYIPRTVSAIWCTICCDTMYTTVLLYDLPDGVQYHSSMYVGQKSKYTQHRIKCTVRAICIDIALRIFHFVLL